MRTLDFENHFITQGWVDALLANDGHPRLTRDESDGKWRLYYQADAFEPFGVMRQAARSSATAGSRRWTRPAWTSPSFP